MNGSSEAKTRTLLAEAQSQHEAKVSNLNSRIRQLEKERDQTEADMSKSLQDRLREVERMRQQISQKDADYAESVRTRQEREARIEEAEDANREMENRLKGLEHLVETMRAEMTKANETEVGGSSVD
jgi:chromosome segregation ATPase